MILLQRNYAKIIQMKLFTYTWYTEHNNIKNPSYGIDADDKGFYFAAFYKGGGFSRAEHDPESLDSASGVKYVNSLPHEAEIKLIEVIFYR